MELTLLLPLLATLKILPRPVFLAGVPAAPSLSLHPQKQEYLPGDTVEIKCSAPPSVDSVGGFQFLSDIGKAITVLASSRTSHIFKMSLTGPEDGGSYHCTYWIGQGHSWNRSSDSDAVLIRVKASKEKHTGVSDPFQSDYYPVPVRSVIRQSGHSATAKANHIPSPMSRGNNEYQEEPHPPFVPSPRTLIPSLPFSLTAALQSLPEYREICPGPVPDAIMNSCLHTSSNVTLLTSSVSSVTGIVFLLLAALIGLPGNLFVVWSILWKMKPSCRSVTCLLVLNLAMADGAVLLLTPFFILFLTFKTWFFGLAVCKGVYYLCCVNMYASIFIITLMSVDRCLAVSRPYLSQAIRKKHLVVKILAALWAAAVLLAVPAFVYRQLVSDLSGRWLICEPCHATRGLAVFHFTMETVVAFVVPFAVIVGCYSAILVRLRGRRWHRRGARTGKLIAAVVLCFAALWVPYHVVNVLQVASNVASGRVAESLGHAWKAGRAGATALAFLSSSINPVLYVFAAGDLIKTSGAKFIAQFFEGASGEVHKKSPSQRDLDKDTVAGEGMEIGQLQAWGEGAKQDGTIGQLTPPGQDPHQAAAP
ncbi:Leukotriene B4 receptor 2 [Chelonia mydas]|uniref:Leukotriene B4 receptor 2 n=1 Tax=Chelonia mydas TaxID=8469 RepID=M7ANL6_CHEMY|nr:Leukotriene B4 receptor 2 [Chelonia mydas]